MRVTKPNWVKHVGDGEKQIRTPIYSISVHPDGTRLATGGLDRKVKIWSTVPILDKEAQDDDSNPKLLCTMSEHTGSVLSVRWAHHGRFLASGSDDQVVMIWGLDPDGGGRLWGSDEVNVENWKPLTRLVGHQADVVDIAWSRDDTMLASTGLDSTVWIWDGLTFDRIRKLDHHQGFVKGVCWDPVGNYLATQSDDKTVKIWDADTWGEVTSISEPFKNSGHATFFRRLSWSPDGAFIAASNAKNGPIFVAAVIEREDWRSEISFVGHQNTIQVAAFNPRLFFSPGEQPGRGTAASMLALGADDFSISIWRNTLHKPIVVLHDIFGRNLLDLCWSNDGLSLYGCSEDGTICAISFVPDELPDLGPPEATQIVLDEYQYKPRRQVKSIAPLINSAPQHSTGFGHSSSTTGAQVNVLQPRKTRPGDQRRRVNLSKPDQDRQQPRTFAPPALAPPAMQASRSDERNDGFSAFDGPIHPLASPSQAQASTARMFKDAYMAFEGETAMDSPRGQKRKASMINEKAAGRLMGGASTSNVDGRELRTVRLSGNTSDDPSSGMSGVFSLSIPAVKSTLRFRPKSAADPSIYFEARNAETAREKNMVAFSQGGKDVWLDYVPSAVLTATVTDRFCAIGCEDRTVIVYSSSGRLLMSLRLPGVCSEMASNGRMLALLTHDGGLRVIDVRTGRAMFPATLVEHLMPSEALRKAGEHALDVRANGVPLLVTSEPAAHAYDPSLQAWIPLITPWQLAYPSTERRAAKESVKGPLSEVEARVHDIWAQDRSRSQAFPASDTAQLDWWSETREINYWEARMRAAELLESPAEYRQAVVKLAQLFAREGFAARAEELLKELTGPIFRKTKDSSFRTAVGTLQKMDLLKDVLGPYNRSDDLKWLAQMYQGYMKESAREADLW